VVYGHHWGDNIGTDFTSLDPTPYLGDINVLFTFHYYDPFAFTGQGLSWLLDGRYRYLTGLTWPYDTANAQAGTTLLGSWSKIQISHPVKPLHSRTS
jgi:hypothetical protein